MISVSKFTEIYPICYKILGVEKWSEVINSDGQDSLPHESLVERLSSLIDILDIEKFLPDLARIELAKYEVSICSSSFPPKRKQYILNPTLEVVPVSWKLSKIIFSREEKCPENVPVGQEWFLIWKNYNSNKIQICVASDSDLLALKVVADDLNVYSVSSSNDTTVSKVYGVLSSAAKKGFILKPDSLIKRDTSIFLKGEEIYGEFVTANTFTLQWHITNACDLHCKHCYDRTRRSPLTLGQGLRILEDLEAFCYKKHVRGHVCFTGGNPFMSPHFFELYQAAADHGFSTSILGNPDSREKIEKVVEIQKPGYFQLSLEGLPKHNDSIRGAGHYISVIEFLGVLRDVGISTAIMLTLTKDNIDQILPLAEKLRGHTEYFTFNRLSPVGEGAQLQLPSAERYRKFLGEYVEASRNNAIMGFKDNLINIILHENNEELFDGCTGFGCGAAFNFIAVLADGEAHACRKFPSPIGNVLTQSILEIYDSSIAQQYRNGCNACKGCSIRHVCGGCLAIASGHRLNIFEEKDPHCFLKTDEMIVAKGEVHAK